MSDKERPWHRPHIAHAARVAMVASVVIAAMYAVVVAAFDLVDRHRLIAQVDARLAERLADATRVPTIAGSRGASANTLDHDDSPVYLWEFGAGGSLTALTSGAPRLSASDWSPSKPSVVAHLGSEDLRLRALEVRGHWFVAGQSLAEADRVRSDVVGVEILAAPVLLLAVFLGTLLVGIKAASPVEQARRRQLEFTADASHELRTPLSVIEAEVSLALSGSRSAEDYRDTLARVNRESQRLRDIVEDLLWLARFDSEPPPPGDEPVDVSVIASTCADRFDAVAQQNGITLSVSNAGESTPWINAPPEWIDRLIAVMVDNACRYAGNGGTVRIVVSAQGSRVSVGVEDSGPGIAPEERANLFDRFHRATDEGNGAGLGLAIADSVVKATGGEWRVGVSELGGARMEVRWHRSPGSSHVGEREVPPGADEGDADDAASPSASGSAFTLA